MMQNGRLLAVFNSAHRVMKAEDALKKAGLAVRLIPAPRALSTDCGLAVIYDADLDDEVMRVLAAENILPTIIYRKDSDTQYEPVRCIETVESAE